MKIQHKIEKFPSQIEERRFGIHLTNMSIQEYEKIRVLLHTIFKYCQYEDNSELLKQVDVNFTLNNVSIYDSNRIQDFNI